VNRMSQKDIIALTEAIHAGWDYPVNVKAKRYVAKFFKRTRTGRTITGHVIGNHGTYTGSITTQGKTLSSACSCYVGASGACHHCHALAVTFLQEPKSFQEVQRKTRKGVKTLDDVGPYLKGVKLEALLEKVKAQGITQKQLAESMGMTPRHLAAIESSELRHRYFNELGATKLNRTTRHWHTPALPVNSPAPGHELAGLPNNAG
jgi:hypothetical protein